jgi:transposase
MLKRLTAHKVGVNRMRGRKPKPLTILPSDQLELERIAHSDTLPWYQVRRARIVLGIATGQSRETLATQLGCDETTIWRTCQRYRQLGFAALLADKRQGHSGRDLQITPLQRAQIVELACLEPIAKGLHITHWASADLARQAMAEGIVSRISPRTVRDLLNNVDLQPHRTRYWKTARLDARFKQRAEQVLWCYGNTTRLAEHGVWVVCVDEVPTFQVVERRPIRRAIPGSIEQQEFDYIRHGTLNLLFFLIVQTGHMGLAFLPANDQVHYIPELERFHQQHRGWEGVYLIQDGGSSHIGAATRKYFERSQAWWKPRLTPANASWLNQAEILIHVFKHHYLNRGSWPSRESCMKHIQDSVTEYNELYAHPFEWTWTNHKMRQWFAKHAA